MSFERTPKAADWARGWPRRCKDLEGLRVRFKTGGSNGWAHYKAGLEGVIPYAPSSWGKVSVRAEACGRCGVGLRITLPWYDLEPIVEGTGNVEPSKS